MVEHLSRQRILDYLDACYGGDIERAASYIDDDIDLICYAPIELFPTLGKKTGKADQVAATRRMHDVYSKIDHEVRFIAADEDKVAAMLGLHLVKRSSGRVITMDIGEFFTLRGGKIITQRVFVDSFNLVEQIFGRDLVPAVTKGSGASHRVPTLLSVSAE